MMVHHTRLAYPVRSFKRFMVAPLLAFALIACTPHLAMAEDTVEHYDARVQEYNPDVELKSSSTGMAWILVVCLGVVCVSVIFMDAKRSHLD